MPSPRHKQNGSGISGNSSIAYTRWEPLNENDNDECDNDDGPMDGRVQVCI